MNVASEWMRERGKCHQDHHQCHHRWGQFGWSFSYFGLFQRSFGAILHFTFLCCFSVALVSFSSLSFSLLFKLNHEKGQEEETSLTGSVSINLMEALSNSLHLYFHCHWFHDQGNTRERMKYVCLWLPHTVNSSVKDQRESATGMPFKFIPGLDFHDTISLSLSLFLYFTYTHSASWSRVKIHRMSEKKNLKIAFDAASSLSRREESNKKMPAQE